MYVYKLTSPNNKHYIGQTQRSTDLRLQEHISAWKRWTIDKERYGTVKLFYAFDQYPPETWSFEILEECSSFEELNQREEYFIQLFDSVQNGYNITYGGDGRKVDCLDEIHKENLSIARKEYFETEEGKEWKKVLSKRFSGENNPSHKRKNEISEQNSKWYLLLDINDNEHIIKNIYQFRRDNPNTVIIVFTEKSLKTKSNYSKYKDYRAILLENYSEDLSDIEKRELIDLFKSKLKPIRKWEAIDPDGNVYITRKLNQFAKLHGLKAQCLSTVANGKSISHKGWKIKLIN